MTFGPQKYAALISYDGTRFNGWQTQKSQPSTVTIQTTLLDAIRSMTSETVSVVGSGRTDSGVHAMGQVAHFSLKNKKWKSQTLQRGLNSLLPESIRILGLKEVVSTFHAQRSAVKKQYSYYFYQGSSPLPHLHRYTWWIRKPLDLDAMQKSLVHLEGEHDFLAFQGSGANTGSTVRTILESDLSQERVGFPLGGDALDTGGLIRLRLVGTGFLKQMVRGIAGTLVQVGERRRDPNCTAKILASKKRDEVGPTAAAKGLWLERVWYRDIEF